MSDLRKKAGLNVDFLQHVDILHHLGNLDLIYMVGRVVPACAGMTKPLAEFFFLDLQDVVVSPLAKLFQSVIFFDRMTGFFSLWLNLGFVFLDGIYGIYRIFFGFFLLICF